MYEDEKLLIKLRGERRTTKSHAKITLSISAFCTLVIFVLGILLDNTLIHRGDVAPAFAGFCSGIGLCLIVVFSYYGLRSLNRYEFAKEAALEEEERQTLHHKDVDE